MMENNIEFVSNKKKTSRRKTLSHLELDEFLRESDNVINTKSQENQPDMVSFKKSKMSTTSSYDDELTLPNIISDSNIKSPDDTYLREAADTEATEEMLMRKFIQCKMDDTAKHIAKQIQLKTNYPIIAARHLYPENFIHPATAFESKREVLMNISPALLEAEKKRKDEEVEREQFTRCKVDRTNKRSSSYEYVDIDSNLPVTPEEYELRYLMFIYKNKPAHLQPSLTQSPVKAVPDATLLPEYSDNYNDDFPVVGHTSNKATRSHSSSKTSSRNRRGTLSPQSAKNMLLTVIEDDIAIDIPVEIGGNTSDLLLLESTKSLTSTITSTFPTSATSSLLVENIPELPLLSMDNAVMSEEGITDDVVEEQHIVRRLHDLLNSPFIPRHMSGDDDDNNNNAVNDTEKGLVSKELLISTDTTIDFNPFCTALLVTNNSEVTEPVLSSNSSAMQNYSPAKEDAYDLSNTISSTEVKEIVEAAEEDEAEIIEECSMEVTIAMIEQRAKDRYIYRMQQAEWKYVWEIASADAARVARNIQADE